MALSNRERIDKGLSELRSGVIPFIERELKAHLGDNWPEQVEQGFSRPLEHSSDGSIQWDTYAILKTMWDQWNTTFRDILGKTERSYVSELIDVRNDHAHEKKFSSDDTERALDTMRRLLQAVGANNEAQQVASFRKELIRLQQAEEVRWSGRKATAVAGTPIAALKPWRDVITPHEDVAKGRYMEAEFAADLNLVHQGKADPEYGDPREFFSRTFLTDGLKELLLIGARRMNGEKADPVVELQTNFGGGKTHSMLALYHLFSGVKSADLADVDQLLQTEKISNVPKANRAVLVGINFGAAETDKKPDGTEVNTLWGEMAWQLGGPEGYAMVAKSDKAGTSPGKELLTKLLNKFSPCIVLIDEWVALLRQLEDDNKYAAGTYGANITFAHSLSEAAKGAPKALVVASLPVSSIEVGGTRGVAALTELENVIKRVAKPWRPADTNEGFEIVRRRLFQSSMDHTAMDAVVKAFSKLYQDNPGEFPSECREASYARQMTQSYPIHPELFQQFEQAWATLEKFQRTRGVLRLMASVIHELWQRDDKNLLIMPSSVTLDSRRVLSLITECLEDKAQWEAVISKDIDGANALPQQLDGEHPTLGRYSAVRRVARTIFMGSAPTISANIPGLEENHVRLGCAQPGEAVATFGDAIRRLSDNAVHLYADKGRYWFHLQPSVTRLSKDRASQLSEADVNAEIVRRLRLERDSGDFSGMHVAPESSADVPDEMEARLVVLGPTLIHHGQDDDSTAMKAAQEYLEKRGNIPRIFRNALVFLAADARYLPHLETATRQYLSWKSIHDEAEAGGMDLTNHARNQAKTKTGETDMTVSLRIHETWSKALVPTQPDPTKPDISWDTISATGGDSLGSKVSKKLNTQEVIYTVLGAPRLKMELDRYLWSGRNHIGLKELVEQFATYLYLPRLVSQTVLQQGIENELAGTVCEFFGYAASWDEEQGKYLNLQTGGLTGRITFDGASVLVKPDIAAKQIEATTPETTTTAGEGDTGTTATGPTPGGVTTVQPGGDKPKETKQKKFYGTVELPSVGAGLKFSEIMQEVVQHFSKDPQNKVKIKVDIEAESPEGFDEATVRTARENAKTLNFDQANFE
jgi:predicted AAA+ superfamily ATPase